MPFRNLGELHRAIYSILSSDPTLLGLIDGRVYNHVPQNGVYPYIAMGTNTGNRWGSMDGVGDKRVYTVSCYGKKKDFTNLYGIEKRVVDLLDKNETNVGSADCCVISVLYKDSVENPLADLEANGRVLDISFDIIIN